MKPSIWVLNGPNLNLLGKREPEIYGRQTLAEIEKECREAADALELDLEFRQTNHEGALIDWVQAATGTTAGLIVNAGAFSHTSMALLDALKAYPGTIIEVHLSNIFKREAYRHHSYVSLAASGIICGFGGAGYILAIQQIAALSQPAATQPAVAPAKA